MKNADSAVYWLERAEFAEDTTIDEIEPYDEDFDVHRARGWYAARRNGNVCRPMFQVFNLMVQSTHMLPYRNPCPACLDFSRSWKCKEHPEREYDRKNHNWKGNDHVL